MNEDEYIQKFSKAINDELTKQVKDIVIRATSEQFNSACQRLRTLDAKLLDSMQMMRQTNQQTARSMTEILKQIE